MSELSTLWGAAVLAAAVAFGSPASAQPTAEYPTRAIRLITPFAPGATTDILSRIISEKMAADWGQPVIVDNRPGAAGLLGTEIVARAPPDGYAIVNVISTHVIHGRLKKAISFDPLKDFAPVIALARTPNVLVIHPSVPARDTKEFIAYAKANPDKLSYGTSGIGSAVHLTMELFKEAADIKVHHVPYRGGAPALQDIIGGHIPVVMSGLFTATEAIRDGMIRALFVTSAQRSPVFPDLPTAQEVGFPGFVAEEWWGILAPAGTPEPIVNKLNAKITEIFEMPDVKARIARLGIEFIGGTPAQFADFMRSEAAKGAGALQKAGIAPE